MRDALDLDNGIFVTTRVIPREFAERPFRLSLPCEDAAFQHVFRSPGDVQTLRRLGGGEILDHGEPDAAGAAAAYFDRSDDDRLVALASAAALFLDTADIDNARDAVPLWAYHRAAKFLQHRPCRLVPVEAELSLKLNRREPRRVGRDQVCGGEPEMKRNARAMQDRTCRHRHLMPARPALKEFPRAQLVRLGVSTSGTPVAVRPAALDEVPATVVFRHEAALELSQGAREVGSGHGPNTLHDPRHNM